MIQFITQFTIIPSQNVTQQSKTAYKIVSCLPNFFLFITNTIAYTHTHTHTHTHAHTHIHKHAHMLTCTINQMQNKLQNYVANTNRTKHY